MAWHIFRAGGMGHASTCWCKGNEGKEVQFAARPYVWTFVPEGDAP